MNVIRLSYTAFVAVLVPVYWVHYGPANFLWFSDIALFAVALSLWTGWRLPYSMMAVGVLPFEILWLLDFAAGGRLGGIAGYMFDDAYPLYLRALSLFHVFMPALIVRLLVRDGYDRRALAAQTALFLLVVPASWLVSTPEENINWVFGWSGPQEAVPPSVYLGLYMLAMPLAVFLPMHALLVRATRRRRR